MPVQAPISSVEASSVAMSTKLGALQRLAQLAVGLHLGFGALITFSGQTTDKERLRLHDLKESANNLTRKPAALSDDDLKKLTGYIARLDTLSFQLNKYERALGLFQTGLVRAGIFVFALAAFALLVASSLLEELEAGFWLELTAVLLCLPSFILAFSYFVLAYLLRNAVTVSRIAIEKDFVGFHLRPMQRLP
jgi:hypothetical protein